MITLTVLRGFGQDKTVWVTDQVVSAAPFGTTQRLIRFKDNNGLGLCSKWETRHFDYLFLNFLNRVGHPGVPLVGRSLLTSFLNGKDAADFAIAAVYSHLSSSAPAKSASSATLSYRPMSSSSQSWRLLGEVPPVWEADARSAHMRKLDTGVDQELRWNGVSSFLE